MRTKKRSGDLSVRAISGTHSVFLAFDMPEDKAKGLMGFAIQRTDIARDETIWLRGNKTFSSTRPANSDDEVRSIEHPFQSFQWADYAATPDKLYQYKVMAMYGKPDQLNARYTVEVSIKTELADDGIHGVFFNRGAIASQEYSRRFGARSPDKVGEAAFNWLGRDLLSGLTEFIKRAKNPTFSLHVAIYEMGDNAPQPLEALKLASQRGVNVRILYHAKPNNDQTAENVQVLTQFGLKGKSVPRTNIPLMHNKFIVLSQNQKPVAVWTGSTNWSRNAFFGQLNVGHSVTDKPTAEAFMDYWSELAEDHIAPKTRDWAGTKNPVPPSAPVRSIEPMFSPRSGRDMMDWWKSLADSGKPLFMTFPFGPGKEFTDLYDQNDGVLRFALMDKFGNGQAKAAAEIALTQIRQYPNIGLSVAPRNKTTLVDRFDGWQREAAGIGVNVNWIHTKFMLIDPLGANPTTITGSANWSVNSVNANDENMIAVFDNQRVADIYFTEFMRLFAHHRFRESVAWNFEKRQKNPNLPAWRPQDLFEDYRKWVPEQYRAGSEKDIRRRYFSN